MPNFLKYAWGGGCQNFLGNRGWQIPCDTTKFYGWESWPPGKKGNLMRGPYKCHKLCFSWLLIEVFCETTFCLKVMVWKSKWGSYSSWLSLTSNSDVCAIKWRTSQERASGWKAKAVLRLQLTSLQQWLLVLLKTDPCSVSYNANWRPNTTCYMIQCNVALVLVSAFLL